MPSPAVSVILPTYNRAYQLPHAIHSVLSQSYSDLELIVVDDGSTDGTSQELSKIKDSRLTVIRQTVNSGSSAARNTGIRASSGSYIAFQDSDTEWFPEKLRKQMELLELRDKNGSYPSACYSRFVFLRYNKHTVVPSDPKDALSGRIYKRLLYGNTMDTPCSVFRRDVLNDVGYFDESLDNLEDWDLALRVAINHSIAFLDEVTLNSHDTPGSVNKLLSPESLIIILNKHYDSFKAYPEAMANITWRIGYEYAMRMQRTEALHYMKISLEQFATKTRSLQFTALRGGLAPYKALLYCRNLLWS
jgi:glycosyltransferase involved in cell wall biosynthesis